MTSIADRFAAQIADLKRRSDESDRKMAEHLANCYRHLEELKRINNAMDCDLA
jgi:hypothetical protein